MDTLKKRVTSSPILMLPSQNLPFRIEADSSDYATGAVLSQKSDKDEKWHPIAFYSRALSLVERNYEIHDKEMLAVIRALEEWRHFVEGTEQRVEIWTDHKNLEYFRTSKKLNRRQARWSLYLSRFDFELRHRPGKSMGKVDALSRRADHGKGSDDNENMVLLKPEFFEIRALGGWQTEGEEKTILNEIEEGVSKEKFEDFVAKAAIELKKSKNNSIRSSEWSTENGLLLFCGKVYVPNYLDLRRRIISQHHDTKIAGHVGRYKTLELISRNYWWPQMSRHIGQYVKTCDLCLHTKTERKQPASELQPLPVPDQRWDTISVDMVVELPESAGYDAVFNMVDSVSKRAHFIPTNTTLTAAGATCLFLHNVWKLHGLPGRVVSDQGPQFVRAFTEELYQLLGIKIAASTAYHPQTDGQTERVNQELKQYLRVFISERQNDWSNLLPLMEFQYNNHVHSATTHTPFMLDTGRDPQMGFEPKQRPSHLESVNEFKQRMEDALEEAKSALQLSKETMALYYNRKHDPTPIFQPGDKVFLDACDIQTTQPFKKFDYKKYGPYTILKPVGTHAYKLRLPPSMHRIHPVFPVVKLTKAPENPFPGRENEPPPPPEIIDDHEEYEVEDVLDSRIRYRKVEFLVKWKGYGYKENEWVKAKDMENAADAVAKFYRTHPEAPREVLSK